MHPAGEAIAAAASGCVGTRFRAQGRTPGVGLDCVGVALIAAAAAGCRATVPAYALGGDHDVRLDRFLHDLGCLAVGVPATGDLLVVAPAPQRRHLAVVLPDGVVHAHAGLGRVVAGPLDPAWAIVAAWRLPARSRP